MMPRMLSNTCHLSRNLGQVRRAGKDRRRRGLGRETLDRGLRSRRTKETHRKGDCPLHDGCIRCGLLVPASAMSLPCCRAWNVMEAQRSVRDVRRYASSRRERRGATNACRLEYPQGGDVMHCQCQCQSTVRQQESRSVPAADLSCYKGAP
jgi:hypothetical protein